MKLGEYQSKAGISDFLHDRVGDAPNEYLGRLVVVSKRLRDEFRNARKSDVPAERAESLFGNVLWYVARSASILKLQLEDIAAKNLSETGELAQRKAKNLKPYDLNFPRSQQLPRRLTIQFCQRLLGKERIPMVTIYTRLRNGDWQQLGNEINDNVYSEDGYRFHDVLHLAYATFLDWSPVIRAMLQRKRKLNPQVDEYEDGARARDIEEALTAFIFKYAKSPAGKFFANASAVPVDLLYTAELLTDDLEVRSRTQAHWQRAILEGYRIFRQVRKHKGGTVSIDRDSRQMRFWPPSGASRGGKLQGPEIRFRH